MFNVYLCGKIYFVMTKNDLIKQCRYYHGEEECPFAYQEYMDNNLRWFWNMERVFVENHDRMPLDAMREEYENFGGKKYSGIPYDLLVIMFTSWAKQAYDIKAQIKNFYKVIDEYLFVANDHYSEKKIPNQ